MNIILVLSFLALLIAVNVESKNHKSLKHHKTSIKAHHSKHESKVAKTHHTTRHVHKRKRLRFDSDSLPYSSPYARPYNWNMYTDGPYGWGPARKRRDLTSFDRFRRNFYPQNINLQQQPAQPAYYQAAPQAAQTRTTLTQSTPVQRLPPLRKQPSEVQQPKERTWVDKMGVTWTTKKVNDYKWGEREPGVVMDEYAGGPFGFDDVKRAKVARADKPAQWHRRSSIPHAAPTKRTWIDGHGVRWTTDHVNDYKWGEREPGVSMDQYNGGPFGWNDVKRDIIFKPNNN